MDANPKNKKAFFRAVFLLFIAACAIVFITARTKIFKEQRAGAPARAAFDKKVLESAATEASLLEVLKHYPAEALVYEKLGDVYSQEKKWDEAIKSYERAGELNPNNPVPFNKAGEICYVRGDMQKAAECWAQAVVIDPALVESHLNLATVYYSQGRLNEAFSQLKEALNIDPMNKKALKMLEQVTKKGRHKSAKP